LTEASDGRTRTLQGSNRTVVAEFDSAGRLTAVTANDHLLLRQTWSPYGQLQKAVDETGAEELEYDANGAVSRVLLTPSETPNGAGQPAPWQEIRFDRAGRISDVKSSWGTQHYDYDKGGLLSQSKETVGEATQVSEWQSGLLRRIRQFDGRELAVDYKGGEGTDPLDTITGLLRRTPQPDGGKLAVGKRTDLPKTIAMPNQLMLGYDYDSGNRLTGVTVGSAYRLALSYDPKGRLTEWMYVPQGH
jgi:YD repeat-containing protein